jgi:uncharacterized protein
MLVLMVLKNKFTKYSIVPLSNRMTGCQIVEKMLRKNVIYDVEVTLVEGGFDRLYNPVNKTVNLSLEVYNGTSVAVAVAAHVCGHAVQHAAANRCLALRSKLVPAVHLIAGQPGGF